MVQGEEVRGSERLSVPFRSKEPRTSAGRVFLSTADTVDMANTSLTLFCLLNGSGPLNPARSHLEGFSLPLTQPLDEARLSRGKEAKGLLWRAPSSCHLEPLGPGDGGAGVEPARYILCSDSGDHCSIKRDENRGRASSWLRHLTASAWHR